MAQDHSLCTTNGIFEDIVLRNIGSSDSLIAEMESADEYERLIPGEQNEKRELGEPANVTDFRAKDHLSEDGNYEDAVDAAGFGKYIWLLVVLCGWANASDGVEILCVSFLLPSAEKDLGLSSTDKGLLNSMIFVGMLVGSMIWGSLADIQGRRKVLIYSLSVNAIFGLASSFAQEFWLFLVFRFFSGVGVGGSVPSIFSYFAEFQQRHRRGMMISIVSTFWLAGNIIAAGLAWAVIPSNLGFHRDNGFSYESWRIFVALCTLPSATSVFTFILLPESPKFLLENGKAEEALEIMRSVFVWNNKGAKKSDYPIAVLLPSSKSKRTRTDDTKGRSVRQCCAETGNKITTIVETNVKLFYMPLANVSIPINVIIFSLAFGFYGLWMWFPQLFKEVEESGAVCVKVNSTSDNSTYDDSNIYLDGFYTALSNLPGNLFAIFLIDVIGRKALLSGSMVLSGLGVFFIYLLQTRTHVLIVSCVFSAVSTIAWNAIAVLGVEIYPTNVRATAGGMQSVFNRLGAILGNLVFGVLIDKNCAVPILTVVAMLALGGIVTLTLPNTVKTPLK